MIYVIIDFKNAIILGTTDARRGFLTILIRMAETRINAAKGVVTEAREMTKFLTMVTSVDTI